MKYRVITEKWDEDEEKYVEIIREVTSRSFWISEGALVFDDGKRHNFMAFAPREWARVEPVEESE